MRDEKLDFTYNSCGFCDHTALWLFTHFLNMHLISIHDSQFSIVLMAIFKHVYSYSPKYFEKI